MAGHGGPWRITVFAPSPLFNLGGGIMFFLTKGPGDDCRSWCRPPGSFVIRNGIEGAGRHWPPPGAGPAMPVCCPACQPGRPGPLTTSERLPAALRSLSIYTRNPGPGGTFETFSPPWGFRASWTFSRAPKPCTGAFLRPAPASGGTVVCSRRFSNPT